VDGIDFVVRELTSDIAGSAFDFLALDLGGNVVADKLGVKLLLLLLTRFKGFEVEADVVPFFPSVEKYATFEGGTKFCDVNVEEVDDFGAGVAVLLETEVGSTDLDLEGARVTKDGVLEDLNAKAPVSTDEDVLASESDDAVDVDVVCPNKGALPNGDVIEDEEDDVKEVKENGTLEAGVAEEDDANENSAEDEEEEEEGVAVEEKLPNEKEGTDVFGVKEKDGAVEADSGALLVDPKIEVGGFELVSFVKLPNIGALPENRPVPGVVVVEDMENTGFVSIEEEDVEADAGAGANEKDGADVVGSVFIFSPVSPDVEVATGIVGH
jgi:hypothetical protein